VTGVEDVVVMRSFAVDATVGSDDVDSVVDDVGGATAVVVGVTTGPMIFTN